MSKITELQIGIVAERSKALVLGTSFLRGVGSNPKHTFYFYFEKFPSLLVNSDWARFYNSI